MILRQGWLSPRSLHLLAKINQHHHLFRLGTAQMTKPLAYRAALNVNSDTRLNFSTWNSGFIIAATLGRLSLSLRRSLLCLGV